MTTNAAYQLESATAQAAGATVTGATRDAYGVGTSAGVSQYAFFNAQAYSDQNGQLFIDQSVDGVTWVVANSAAYTGGIGATITAPIMAQFYRARVINGGTLQTTFSLRSSFSTAAAEVATGSTNQPIPSVITAFQGNLADAFGRLRVSTPYTLFDGQARYAADSTFNYSTANGGTTTYNTNASSVSLSVTTTSGSSAIGQTYRVFPYQPGKSMRIMQTFTMAPGQTNLTQRVGLYGTNNGIYLEQANGVLSFVIRTFTSGSVNNSRFVTQANWNVDKFDGTGPSGVVLDVTKTQIFWMDLEWLGVGNVRLGFVNNGTFYTAHIFQNANTQTVVYMQTAILPLRNEIFTTGTTASAATFQQICATVQSEGGYEQVSQQYVARNGTSTITATTSFIPIVSIRLNSSYLGAVVIPASINFLPIGNAQYEVALFKNLGLTGATYASTMAGGQVDVDIAATAVTAPTADQMVQNSYATASNQSQTSVVVSTGYNWDTQLGVSIAGVSDTYTLAARALSGSGACTGSISFWNLTV
jgi:hypothetical protein